MHVFGKHYTLFPGSSSWLPCLRETQAGSTLLAGQATSMCLSGMSLSRGQPLCRTIDTD